MEASHEDIRLDTARKRVSVLGRDIELTKKEYEILRYMLTHRKQILTSERIYNVVWKAVFLGDNAIIFFRVAQLGKTLDTDRDFASIRHFEK